MNLFNFDYETETLNHKSGEKSHFSVVYGEGGNIMHCKKDSYELVKTAELSKLGEAFLQKDKEVSTFVHRNGETIGLNIDFGCKPTKVGDKCYKALITVPNNGSGRGYLSVKEIRLICTNGAVRSSSLKVNSIKIPHIMGYEASIKLMQESLTQFENIIVQSDVQDKAMSDKKLDRTELRFHLNKWFYEYEMPLGHKSDLSFAQFREALVTDADSIKTIARYQELIDAMERELVYNTQLNLDVSMFTVYATVNNYLSRRIEASKSSASDEVQFMRQGEKLKYFVV